MGQVDPEFRPSQDLYAEAIKALTVRAYSQEGNETKECIICMMEFSNGDLIAQLKCD